MRETTDDLLELQALLDRSFGRSSAHLLSIMSAGRRLSAGRIAADLQQPVVLNVATVTTAGEPRISALDGHFLRGRWWFGTAAAAVKARHLDRRPAVSASHTPRDGYGIFCHGQAERIAPDNGAFAMLEDHLIRTYGHGADGWGEPVAFYRIEPTWMVGFAMTDDVTPSSRGTHTGAD